MGHAQLAKRGQRGHCIISNLLTSMGRWPSELNSATTRADVMRWSDEGWAGVFAAVDALRSEDVMRTVTIRGEAHTVLQASNRRVAHYAHPRSAPAVSRCATRTETRRSPAAALKCGFAKFRHRLKNVKRGQLESVA